jgi:hypothetical protein
VKVCIRLFAVAKELAGSEMISVELPEGSSVAQLRAKLAQDMPVLAGVLPHFLFAVGSE